MTQLRKLRLFVASPGDVQIERRRVAQAIRELNQTVGSANNLVLELVVWENDARPEMGRIQAVINRQIGDFDIFVGIMWRRFGTPSGDSSSGTEEEFRRAYSSWQKTKRPNILLYFSEASAAPPKTVDEARQMLKVAEFREEVEDKGLTWTYSDPEFFDDVLRPHLHKLLLDEYCSKPDELGKPLDPKLKSLLEIEKHECREQNVSYLTSHLILRLIKLPGSFTKKSFEEVQPGVCELIKDRLEGFLKQHTASGATNFRDFKWENRPEVRDALGLAQSEKSTYIREKHLLLSLLRSEGKTITKLKNSLFPGESYEQLLVLIEAGPEKKKPAHTEDPEMPTFSFKLVKPPEET